MSSIIQKLEALTVNGGLLHQIKGGFTTQSQQSQQSLQSEQSHPKPEAFDCLLDFTPNIMIHY